jgi:exosortase
MQNNKTIGLVFTTILVFLFTYFPALELLVDKWSNSEDYAHSFLIVPIVLYMIWKKREVFDQNKDQNYAGGGLVLVSVFLYACALQIEVPTAIFVAVFLTIVSVLVYLGGFSILKELTIPILLLFMVIPIPNQLYSMVTFPLQLKISQVNEFLIQLMGVPIYREGNVLNVPGKSFQVVEACSGMRSLISLSTLSLVVGYFMLQKSRLKCCLFALSFPIAFLVNVVRVMVLVVAFHYFKLDLSSGIEHTITGMVIFMFGLVLLYGLQRVLEFWDT